MCQNLKNNKFNSYASWLYIYRNKNGISYKILPAKTMITYHNRAVLFVWQFPTNRIKKNKEQCTYWPVKKKNKFRIFVNGVRVLLSIECSIFLVPSRGSFSRFTGFPLSRPSPLSPCNDIFLNNVSFPLKRTLFSWSLCDKTEPSPLATKLNSVDRFVHWEQFFTTQPDECGYRKNNILLSLGIFHSL